MNNIYTKVIRPALYAVLIVLNLIILFLGDPQFYLYGNYRLNLVALIFFSVMLFLHFRIQKSIKKHKVE